MTTFEDELRRELHRAAEAAPAYRWTGAAPTAEPARPDRPDRPGRGRRRWYAVAAALVVAAVVTGAVWTLRPSSPPLASCAGVLVVDGRNYLSWGDLVSVPRATDPVGTGTVPACSDGPDTSDRRPARTTDLYPVPGVGTAQAVFADGRVWIPVGADVPAGVRALTEPVSCRLTGDTTSEGTITALDPGADPTRPPYAVTFAAESGTGLPLEGFSSVALQVAVPSAAVVRGEAGAVGTALRDGRRVRVVLRCAGSGFVARELSLVP